MESNSGDTGWSPLDFILELRRDVEGEGVRTLNHYLGLFPGHETDVQREYTELVGETGKASREETLVRVKRALVRELMGLTADDPSMWLDKMAEAGEVPELAGPDAGMVIGHYRLMQLLGRGGMGQVWQARDSKLDRDVALKLLNSRTPNERSVSYFEREARAAARLSHAGIVAVYEAGEADGQHYIAMELVTGGNTLAAELDAFEHEPSANYEHIAGFFAHVCDALQVAHAAGVLHRDLKPQNILIDGGGEPKVTDFGLAKIVDEESLSQIGQGAGTYAYMSPEQVTLKHIGIDHRTDIFSLGIVFYETLTATRPFKGDTTQQVAQNILFEDPPDVRSIASRVPSELAVICAKALEKKPSDRFGSMGEFADELRRYLAHEPIVTRPPGPLQRAMRWAQRHPVKSSAGSIAVAAFGVVTFLSVLLWQRGKDIDARRVAAVENAQKLYATSVRGAQLLIESVRGAQLLIENGIVAPDVLEDCPLELRGFEWGHLRMLADPSLHALPGHTDSISALTYDPRGMRIASASHDGTVLLWDHEEDDLPHTFEQHTGAVLDVEFSPDGKWLVSASSDKTLCIWDATTGELLEQLGQHEAGVTALAVHPNGTYVASGDADGGLIVWDTTTWAPSKLGGHGKRIQVIEFSSDGLLLGTGGHDELVRVWNVSTGEPEHEFKEKGEVIELDFHPTAARVLSGSMLGHLSVWDLQAGAMVAEKQRKMFPVSVARFSPDGTAISSATWNTRYGKKSWERRFGRPLSTAMGSTPPNLWWSGAALENDQLIAGQVDFVTAAAIRHDGGRVVTAALDRRVRLFDPLAGALTGEWAGHRAEVTAIAYRPDGARVVSGGADGQVLVWDATTKGPMRQLEGHAGRIAGVAFSSDGTLAFTASRGGSLRVWNGLTGRSLAAREVEGDLTALACTRGGEQVVFAVDGNVQSWAWRQDVPPTTLGRHDTPVHSLTFDADERRLISVAQLGWTEDYHEKWESAVWDVAAGSELARLAGLGVFHPDASRVAVWGEAGRIELRDTESFEVVRSLDGLGQPRHMAFTVDGRRLACGSSDKTVSLWHVESGARIATLPHRSTVMAVAFSADGSRLVSYDVGDSRDYAVRVWDGETGERVAELPHTGEVRGARFDASGERLVTWSVGEPPRLWDARSGATLILLAGHADDVTDVAFSSDLKRILTGSADGVARLWYSDYEQARTMWNSGE
ncbi:MAG: protein kinase [bacterium]|nr:protein kinase [bacterium]